MSRAEKLFITLVMVVGCLTPVQGQSILMSATLATLSGSVQGRLDLTTIDHFTNGRELPGNLIRVSGLNKNRSYVVRMWALSSTSLTNGSTTIPWSNFTVTVNSTAFVTAGATFSVNPVNTSGTAINTGTLASASSTTGTQLTSFQVANTNNSDNSTVDISFTIRRLANSGTSNLFPGDDGSPRVYGPVTLLFHIYDGATSRASAQVAFRMGIQNALQITSVASDVATSLRMNSASIIRNINNNVPITKTNQILVSSNQDFNVSAFAAQNLGNGSLRTVPIGQIQLRYGTTGTYRTLNTTGTATGNLNSAVIPRGINQPITIQYRLAGGAGLLVPAGSYNTTLNITATQQ